MFIKRGDGKILSVIKIDDEENLKEACEKAKKIQEEQKNKSSNQSGDN